MNEKRVFVTDGAGFIGSNLTNHLTDKNEVVAVDDLYFGTPENPDDAVELHDANVLDDDPPVDDVDVVFHLATLSSHRMHEENLTKAARVNVEDFVNTVKQVRNDSCGTVVYASISSIYSSQTKPSPEEMPVETRMGYETSKLARERYAEHLHYHYGMRTVGLRFFSVYQSFGGAEEHEGEFASMVAQLTDKIATGELPELFGDGIQTRDFIHVDDTIRGIGLAVDYRSRGIYNPGTGEGYSLNEMVGTINKALGADVEPEYIEDPLDIYIHDMKADCTKIRETTGWEPKIPFEGGLRHVRKLCFDEQLVRSVG